MKKLIICVFMMISIGGCWAMQQSAPDDQSTPDVPADQDIPEVPAVPEMPSISAPEWAAGIYHGTVETYDDAVSHIPEISMSGVGQGSYASCCCNRAGFKTGCSQCRHRNDFLFAITGGCCCGLCCLNDQGRIVPVLLLERCCCACKSQTPLDQIPDSSYSSCSQIMVNGCVCSAAAASLLMAILGFVG